MEEIDNKEASDALHMLLHCSLKDTEFETQKEQFEIVSAYIKTLESDNYELNNRINDLLDSVPKSVIKEKIEELQEKDKESETNIYGYGIHFLQELLEKGNK